MNRDELEARSLAWARRAAYLEAGIREALQYGHVNWTTMLQHLLDTAPEEPS